MYNKIITKMYAYIYIYIIYYNSINCLWSLVGISCLRETSVAFMIRAALVEVNYMRRNWPLWSPVVSRGLPRPLTTGRRIYKVPKIRIRHWNKNYDVKEPPRFGGVRLPTFCPGGTVASFWLKFNQKLAYAPFVSKKPQFISKIQKKDDVYQFLGPQNIGKRPFLVNLFLRMIFFFLHNSFGLPGPLQTAFELKNCTAYSKKTARCDCANGNAINWLQRPKNIKILFRIFPNFPKIKKWQIWGAQ